MAAVIYYYGQNLSMQNEEDFEVLAEKNRYLGRAYQQLQVISQDAQKRLEYEARQKTILDYNQGMLEARKKAREEATIKIARNLLESGFSIEEIAQNTGLSVSQIEHLKEKS